MLCPAGSDVPRDDGNYHAGEDAAGHDLEQHIRQRVRGVVGITQTGISDGLREDHRPAEAQQA
jgi:hypothetical protein